MMIGPIRVGKSQKLKDGSSFWYVCDSSKPVQYISTSLEASRICKENGFRMNEAEAQAVAKAVQIMVDKQAALRALAE